MKRKARSIVLGTCTAVALLFCASTKASVFLSLSDGTGDPNSVALSPGATFNVRLQLTSTAESVLGLSYYLETLGLGSSQFRIIARDIIGSPFDDPITTDAITLQANNALLDPRNNTDLGALVSGPPAGVGLSFVANYSIQALPAIAPGHVYVIRTASGTATDDSFNDIALAPTSYSVQVVPEPSSAALAGIGAVALLARRRRRQEWT